MRHLRLYQFLAAVCCLCAFLCATASAVYSCVLNRNTMYSGFLLYARTERFGVGPERYGEYAQTITDYLSGRTDRLTVTDADGQSRDAFSEKENLHMEDVRKLIGLLSSIRLGTGAAFLGLAAVLLLRPRTARGEGDRPALLRAAALGAGVWLLLSAGLTALALSGFDSFFISFHRLFFDNNLWLLNPQTDLLIALMPTPFFVWYGGEILKKLLPLAALAVVLTLAVTFLSRRLEKESKTP